MFYTLTLIQFAQTRHFFVISTHFWPTDRPTDQWTALTDLFLGRGPWGNQKGHGPVECRALSFVPIMSATQNVCIFTMGIQCWRKFFFAWYFKLHVQFSLRGNLKYQAKQTFFVSSALLIPLVNLQIFWWNVAVLQWLPNLCLLPCSNEVKYIFASW